MQARATGPFRGLAPLSEADAEIFFGRDAEQQKLREFLNQDRPLPILVVGESGVGKTSLLRAALLPKLKRDGLATLYLSCGAGWMSQLRVSISQALGKQLPIGQDPVASWLEQAVQQKNGVVVLDHVEALLWIDEAENKLIRQHLIALHQSGFVRLVFAVDRGNLHALRHIDERLLLLAEQSTLSVSRWDRATTARVAEQLVVAGGIYMEAGLPELMAQELTAKGPILPASLQVLGHAATLRRISRIKDYRSSGGALALSSHYVSSLTDHAGGSAAERVLSILIDDPSARPMVELERLALELGWSADDTQQVVDRLQRVGLVTQDADSRYGLIHPYLRQPVRDNVATFQHGRAAAKVALQRRLNNRQILRPDELLRVFCHVGRGTLNDREASLYQRSLWRWGAVAAALIFVPILFWSAVFFQTSRAVYLTTATQLGLPDRLVVRKGNPSWNVPGHLISQSLDRTVIDTGMAASLLKDTFAAQLAQSPIVVSHDRMSTLAPWFEAAADAIPAAQLSLWLHYGGAKELARQTLQRGISDPAQLNDLIEWTVSLWPPDEVDDIRLMLVQGLKSPQPQLRKRATEQLQKLPKDTKTLTLLGQALQDNHAAVRLAAMHVLVTYDALEVMRDLLPARLFDQDIRVQKMAHELLNKFVSRDPVSVLWVLKETLLPKWAVQRLALTSMFEVAIQRSLLQLQPPHLKVVIAWLGQAKTPIEQRELMRWLSDYVATAKTELNGAEILPTLAALQSNPDATVSAAAVALMARFEPAEAALEHLKGLAYAWQPRKAVSAIRQSAAHGLGVMTNVNNSVLNQQRFDLLKRLLHDGDRDVRREAVGALLRMGGPGLQEVLKTMRTGGVDITESALSYLTVGEDERYHKWATAIISAAFKDPKIAVRTQALRSAQALATTSPRLNMWLADQASIDKDLAIRLGGIDSAVTALHRGGKAYARLARLYLTDKDPTIRAKALEVFSQRPLTDASYLWSIVEKLVRDPEIDVRRHVAAVAVFTAPRTEDALRVLSSLLKDEVPRVRANALLALSTVDATGISQPVRDALIAQLEGILVQPGTDLALNVVRAAAKLQLWQPLERCAGHPEPRVRSAALRALQVDNKAIAKNPRLVTILEAGLRDVEMPVRLAALQMLGRVGSVVGPVVVPLLWQSTFATMTQEREAAFDALGQLGEGSAASAALKYLLWAAQDESEARRTLGVQALSHYSTQFEAATRAMIDAVVDSASDVRRQALVVLCRHLAAHATPAQLWQLLSAYPHNPLLQRVAIVGLSMLAQDEHHKKDVLAFLQQQVIKPEYALATRVAGHLALGLAKQNLSPFPATRWFYGW